MKPLTYFPFVAMVLLVAASFAGQSNAQQSAVPKAPPKPAISAPVDYSVKPEEVKDLRIAQLEFQAAQKDLNAAVLEWNNACESLRVSKHWPEGTTCRIDTGAIVPPPPLQPPVPASVPVQNTPTKK